MKTLSVILLLLSSTVLAQVHVPFDCPRWTFENKEHAIETYLGKQALRIKQNRVFLKDADFLNGVIEFDMAFPQGRAFISVSFRGQDEGNYEDFYIRTHQSGNPDANQYTPVYGGLAAWQLYYGEGYAVPFAYEFNQWLHVKLVINDKYMDVYLNDMETPVLFAELKRTPKKGYIGFGNFRGENHFANFTYTAMEKVALKGKPKPPVQMEAGTIAQWEVSNPISEKMFGKVTSLKDLGEVNFTWTKAQVEPTGTLNLASVADWSQEGNTVLTKVVVDSDRDQVKKFSFGFSDRARVFLNGTLLFSGEDNFVSRDYRFLGTIGYYDAVYLPLKKGKNEIIIAVSEDFGGWGVKAKFENSEGIVISH